MERNSRRSSEVDKLQRGLECVTKSVDVSKIRIYFQRKKCKQKWCGYFQKVITIIWKKKMRNMHSNLYNSLCLGSWKPKFQ